MNFTTSQVDKYQSFKFGEVFSCTLGGLGGGAVQGLAVVLWMTQLAPQFAATIQTFCFGLFDDAVDPPCDKLSAARTVDRRQRKMTSWREVARPLRQLRTQQISRPSAPVCARKRWYSAEGAAAAARPALDSPLQDIEAESSLGGPGPTPEQLEEYREPWKRAQRRKYQLPANRYDLRALDHGRSILLLVTSR